MSSRKPFDLLDALVLLTVGIHIWICPYTKVEESFNLQAVHDILYHGPNLQSYDHFEFPGVVPRTFLGALVVSGVAKPFQLMADYAGWSKLASLYIARFALGALLVFAFGLFRRAVARKFGPQTATFLVVIQLVQFHLNFYMSRTLPNTFALFLVLIGYYGWLDDKPGLLFACLTSTTVIFRSEVIALFGPIALETLLSRKISFPRAVLIGAVSGVVSLLLTIFVDSVMWGRWLWPEGEVLYYNTYLNKSKNWGVSPFYWYFLIAIPKTMMTTIAFIPIGLFYERRLLPYVVPILTFVFLYSFLPHKELRFIFYAFPILNMVAASGISRFMNNVAKKRSFLVLPAMGLVVLSLIFAQGFLYVSHYNYPGGEAFKRFHEMVPASETVRVHIDVPSAQTGVSRFGQLNDGNPNWVYDKTEDLAFFDQFTHIISANATILTEHAKFVVMEVIESFSGIQRLQGPPFVQAKFAPSIYIHKRV